MLTDWLGYLGGGYKVNRLTRISRRGGIMLTDWLGYLGGGVQC